MSDPELTRQDEEISAAAFSDEEERDPHHDFGSWPEAAGVVLTLFVTWLIFAFTG